MATEALYKPAILPTNLKISKSVLRPKKTGLV